MTAAHFNKPSILRKKTIARMQHRAIAAKSSRQNIRNQQVPERKQQEKFHQPHEYRRTHKQQPKLKKKGSLTYDWLLGASPMQTASSANLT